MWWIDTTLCKQQLWQGLKKSENGEGNFTEMSNRDKLQVYEVLVQEAKD